MSQNKIRNILLHEPIVPVVKINALEEVRPLISFLKEKKINCIEITLRTECAYDAIKLAREYCGDEFKVGAGTLVNSKQLNKLVDIGVDFIVLPGLQKELIGSLKEINIPFLPGVMTPSEIIQAHNLGWDTLKFFPANVAGGIKALKTYLQVFPQLKFCPTGGISKENYLEYLSLENVISVGGSWVQKELK